MRLKRSLECKCGWHLSLVRQINELAPELLMACQDAVVRLMRQDTPGDEALDVISDLREVIDQAYGKWCPPGTK